MVVDTKTRNRQITILKSDTLKNLLRLLKIIIILALVYHDTNAQWGTDTVTFETPESEIVIDTVGSNVWHIGKPQKTFFDTAHSGINAILTDTSKAYPINDTSSFIYVIRNAFTQTCYTCMEFWHKYDTDTLADKGLIDASYDGGNSWIQVKDTFDNASDAHFMWNADYHALNGNYTNHLLITSGKSDGWIRSGFCWLWYLAVSPDTIIINPDSLLIRFTFITDSIAEEKEGWMIDDISITAQDPNLCTGIQDNYVHEDVTVYPNPFSTGAILQSENGFKNATLTIYNALGAQVKQLKNISGESITLDRDDLPGGLYFLQLTQDNKILKTVKIVITDN